MFSRSITRYCRQLLLIMVFSAVLLASRSGHTAAGQPPDDFDLPAPFMPVIDETPVSLTGEILTCNGPAVSFEAGIPPAWTVVDNVYGTGVTWTTTADPACGISNLTNGSGEAACADSDTAAHLYPYDTLLKSNIFDLSTWDEAALSVKAYYKDLNTGSNDQFRVYVLNGTSWDNVLTWDEDHEPQDIFLDLTTYSGLGGLGVAFQYFGDGYDWYAEVDDVSLTCVAYAQIDIDPMFIGSTQEQGKMVSNYLNISDSGKGDLSWQIDETSAADCYFPTSDVPWLEVSRDSGTTPAGSTTILGVTFDSAGLSPGTYSAIVCISSNDPDYGPGNGTEMVQVGVEMVVEPASPKVFLPYVSRSH